MAENTSVQDPTSDFSLPPDSLTQPESAAAAPKMDTASMFGGVDALAAAPDESLAAAGAEEYGFDDQTVKAYDFEFYKGHKNITDRIGILADKVIGARVHYTKLGNLGYFVCNSTFKKVPNGAEFVEVPDKKAVCCNKLGSPFKRFIAPIIQYSTQPNGNLQPQLGYSIKALRYKDSTYIMLRTINSQFPLNQHDLLVTCTQEEWQRLNFQACRDSVVRHKNFPADAKTAINAIVAQLQPKMAKTLAKRHTDQELMIAFGMAAPAVPVAAASMDVPMVDVATLLGD
jgi:hypothetical protein